MGLKEHEVILLEKMTYQDLVSPRYAGLAFTNRKALFEKIFKVTYRSLVSFVHNFTHDRDIAQDVASETFIKLYSRLHLEGYCTPKQLRAFLFITAKNKSLNLARHEGVKRKYEKEMMHRVPEAQEESVTSSMVKAELMGFIINWMEEALPPSRREVFRLGYIEGLSNGDIAEKLDISISTIKTQKARGMLALREVIASKHGI